MNINQKELNIKNLLKKFSIETTPNVYDKYGNFLEKSEAILAKVFPNTAAVSSAIL